MVVYSFIVDGHPRFLKQARIFTASLRAAGVPPRNIIAHVAPGVSVEGLGVRGVPLKPPAIGGGVFNKIGQLRALRDVEAETFVLCDTDLAFLARPDAYAQGDRVWGKPVDNARPPLALLEALRQRAGIATQPRIVPTSCDEQPTFAGNCNGGLYILPRRVLLRLFRPWQEYTRLVRDNAAMLGNYIRNADQMGFALAMLHLGEDVGQLPVEWNFPCHMVGRFDRLQEIRPMVLHHHQDGDRLEPVGHTLVDEAIARVNRLVGG